MVKKGGRGTGVSKDMIEITSHADRIDGQTQDEGTDKDTGPEAEKDTEVNKFIVFYIVKDKAEVNIFFTLLKRN